MAGFSSAAWVKVSVLLGSASVLAPTMAQAQTATVQPQAAQTQTAQAVDAQAQAAGPGAAPQETRPGDGVQDIIVTAQRREESIQRTPIAVTAISAQDIRTQNITTVADIARVAPNLTISSYSYNAPTNTVPIIYIRGIGQQDPSLYSDPGVPVYVDGVYVARSAGGAIDLPDVQRVEVLRGPQGTLFGKNAVGGAVNIVTRTPGASPATRIDVSAGNYHLFEARGFADFQASDTLGVTLAFDAKTEDGWGKRLDLSGGVLGRLGDQRHLSGRAKVRWTPTDRFTVDLAADYTRYNDTGGPSQTQILPGNLVNWNALVGSKLGTLVTPATSAQGRYNNYSRNPQAARDRIFGASATLAYELGGGITVKSITAYRTAKQVFARDADSGPARYFEISRNSLQRQFTEELQIGGRILDNKVDFIAGAFFLHDNSYELNSAIIAPGLAPINRGPDISRNYNDYQITDSHAAFAQATWHIVPRLNFTAGLRYTEDKKDATVFVDSPDTKIIYVPTTPVGDKWHALTPRFALDFQATNNILVYASAARGFKSGGFNERPKNLIALTEFFPEDNWSYEAGVKSDLFDHHVRANVAVFRSDYRNIQLTRQTMIDGQPVSDINNVAGARIQGFEGELTLVPTRAFQITGSVGYLDDKYTELQPGAIVTQDDHIPYVSRWTASVSARYTIDLAGGGQITPSANYAYRTGSNVQPHNTAFAYLPARGLLSARIAYTPRQANWDFAVFGTNLTDQLYLASVGDSSGSGNIYRLFGKPLEVGATFSVHF